MVLLIGLGALGTLILFILQVTGVISVSVWLILTPLLAGIILWGLFLIVVGLLATSR